MFLKIKKIVGVSAAAVLVVSWFAIGFLDNTFVNYPRFPNLEQGRTVPYATKGIVVYITQAQHLFLHRLTWIAICSASIMALVVLIHRGDPFKSKK
jgi:hypothetical protein